MSELPQIKSNKIIDLPENSSLLEQEDPAAVQEDQNSEHELDRIAKGFDVENPLVKRFPETVLYI